MTPCRILAIIPRIDLGDLFTSLVLNLSCGRTPAADQADAQGWAARYRAMLEIARPFTLWDGSAFVLRRPH